MKLSASEELHGALHTHIHIYMDETPEIHLFSLAGTSNFQCPTFTAARRKTIRSSGFSIKNRQHQRSTCPFRRMPEAGSSASVNHFLLMFSHSCWTKRQQFPLQEQLRTKLQTKQTRTFVSLVNAGPRRHCSWTGTRRHDMAQSALHCHKLGQMILA